ncbi:MAG: NUDIX domain-containing protein, partial [Kangiellaceae bacterium]|nr:NUDIX domain-containing protein [Kangiellaceae bacterium]
LRHGNQVWLEKRPSTGIWGGLWSVPEFDNAQSLTRHVTGLFGDSFKLAESIEPFRHTFSHYHLDITPVTIELSQQPSQVMDTESGKWQDRKALQQLGLPSAVSKLLNQLT